MKQLFILGNGISLQHTNLDLLIGHESWAMNKIPLLWEEIRPDIKWRPSRVWWGDSPELPADWRNVVKLIDSGATVYVRDHLLGMLYEYGLEGTPENMIIWLADHTRDYGWERDLQVPPWDLSNQLVNKKTSYPWPGVVYPHMLQRYTNSMNALLQAAWHEGYRQIILLGCDVGFEEGSSDHHFHPDYYATSLIRAPHMFNDEITLIHKLAKEFYDANGGEILNATVGGELEIHPRVRLEEVINGN